MLCSCTIFDSPTPFSTLECHKARPDADGEGSWLKTIHSMPSSGPTGATSKNKSLSNNVSSPLIFHTSKFNKFKKKNETRETKQEKENNQVKT